MFCQMELLQKRACVPTGYAEEDSEVVGRALVDFSHQLCVGVGSSFYMPHWKSVKREGEL